MRFSPVLLSVVMVAAVLSAEFADKVFMILMLLVLLTAFMIRSAVFRKIDFTALLLILGFFCAFASHSYFTGEANHRATEYINRYVTLKGTVITQAQPGRYGEGYRYILSVKNAVVNNSEEKLKDTLLLTTDKKLGCGLHTL